MRAASPPVPVVVLHSCRYQGLAISRSLGRLGIPVFNIESDRLSAAFFSRYSRGAFLRAIGPHEPLEGLAQLIAIGESVGCRPILMTCSDPGAEFVARHSTALEPYFRFASVPVETVRALRSKKEMHGAAVGCGIPAPMAAFPASLAEAAGCAAEMRYPVVVKRIAGASSTTSSVTLVRDREGLQRVYDSVAEPGELMLQEYIPGGDDSVWMFNGYFRADSSCAFGATGRKIRQYPVHAGVTSLGVCLPNEAVRTNAIRFIEAMGYRGMVDMGFRYDARDGLYKVLDVNPRIGATFRLFSAPNGMDVARACYLDLTGQPVPEGAPEAGRKWVVEDFDLMSGWRHYVEGLLSLGGWLASYRGVREYAYLAIDDPLPAFIAALRDIRALFASIRGQGSKSLEPRNFAAGQRC